jgi:hypothetical protein
MNEWQPIATIIAAFIAGIVGWYAAELKRQELRIAKQSADAAQKSAEAAMMQALAKVNSDSTSPTPAASVKKNSYYRWFPYLFFLSCFMVVLTINAIGAMGDLGTGGVPILLFLIPLTTLSIWLTHILWRRGGELHQSQMLELERSRVRG